MCANSEGCGETVPIRRLAEPLLVTYVISTIISWTGLSVKISWTFFHIACDEGCTRELMSDMDELEAKLNNLPFNLSDPNITAPFGKLRRIEADAKKLKVKSHFLQSKKVIAICLIKTN